MRIFLTVLLFFTLSAAPVYADPGNGKGNGSEKSKGKAKGKGKGNSYAKGGDDHEAAASTIAATISAKTGQPPENYSNYAASLADTLGQLSPEDLAEVLGEYYSGL